MTMDTAQDRALLHLGQALRDRGVRVDALFFPPETEPKLPHEYQFDLGRPEGKQALERLTAFLEGLSR